MLSNIGTMHQMCVKQNRSGSESLSHQYILHCRISLALLIFKIYLEKQPSTNRTPVMSPAKIISTIDDEENNTPRTMLLAMQTAMTTPATPRVPGCVEDVEYSFEERRTSFVLPKLYLRSLLHL